MGWNDGPLAGESRVGGHLRTNSISCAGAPYLFQGPHKLYESLLSILISWGLEVSV